MTWMLLNATEEESKAFDERLDEVLAQFDTLEAQRDERLREAFPGNKALQAIAKDWRGQIRASTRVKPGDVLFGRVGEPERGMMSALAAYEGTKRCRPKPLFVAFVHPIAYDAMKKAIKP
jgi:hypothetical protein